MSAHLARRVLEVALPILRGADVALQGQAAFGKELRKLLRVDPPGQPLAGLLEGGEEPLRADEPAGPRQHVAVNVGEEQQASGRRARAPSQGGVDGGLREVVRDAFQEEEAARRLAVAGSRHGGLQVALAEVAGDEPDVLRQDGERALQRPSLRRLRVWMVDFEDGDSAQARQPVRPGVEPRAEDDELLRVRSERGRDRIVDQPGARYDRGAHPRPPPVDGPGHQTPQAGSERQPGHEGERPAQEGAGERILEEPSALGE